MNLKNIKYIAISLMIAFAIFSGMLLQSGVILADDTPIEPTLAGESAQIDEVSPDRNTNSYRDADCGNPHGRTARGS